MVTRVVHLLKKPTPDDSFIGEEGSFLHDMGSFRIGLLFFSHLIRVIPPGLISSQTPEHVLEAEPLG